MADQLAAALGFAAAGAAPLVGVFGFTIWGKHWTGHPYMLNCFKGFVATIFFMLFFIGFSVIAPLAGWDASLDRFTRQVIGWLLLSSLLMLQGDPLPSMANGTTGKTARCHLSSFGRWRFSPYGRWRRGENCRLLRPGSRSQARGSS